MTLSGEKQPVRPGCAIYLAGCAMAWGMLFVQLVARPPASFWETLWDTIRMCVFSLGSWISVGMYLADALQ